MPHKGKASAEEKVKELEEATLGFVQHGFAYEVVKTLSEEQSLPVWKLCDLLHLTRSAYYLWLKRPKSLREQENERIAEQVKKIHKEDGIAI